MTLAKIIPLAFVMIAGPQILAAIFLATSEKWAGNSAALVGGAAVSITATVTLAFLLSDGASKQGASSNALDIIIMVLLIAAGVHTFLTRKTSKPPKWMGKLEEEKPKGAFRLGFLLLGVFPTDAVGGSVAAHHHSWFEVLPFVLVTLLFLGLPALCVLLLGEKAKKALPKIRDWMNNNSWIISECVIGLFVVITASSL
jgi:threonine/homoserine/homoserine lactone efflux protein